MNDPALAPRKRKVIRILLWGGLGGVILLIAAWVTLSALASRKISRALEDLRQAGYATSLADLAPPAILPSRNGASEYLAAFTLLPDSDSEDPDLEAAEGKALTEASPETRAAVSRLLDRSAAGFARIRAARERGSCRFSRRYEDGLGMELPELSGMVAAGKLLRLRAQAEAAAGRTSESRQSVLDILALADAYREEPLLILQLVRFVLLSQAVDAVHGCVTAETPEADLEAWLAILPSPESVEGAVELSLRGETACAAMMADGIPMGGAKTMALPSGLGSWWLKWSIARHLGLMRGVIETSRKPYRQARKELTEETRALQDRKSFLDMISLLLLPSVAGALDQQKLVQASLSVLRAGLAAEIERARTGRYPDRSESPDPLADAPLRLAEGALSSAGVPDRSPEDAAQDRLVWKFRRK